MMRLLLVIAVVALVIIPAVEIATFIQVGGRIGALPTILLTLFTAALGIWLVRLQGMVALVDVQRAMVQGRAPLVEMLSGALLLLAGILLLIPGFVTDALGFVLLITPVRGMVAALLARGLLVRSAPGTGGASGKAAGDVRIIEVEVTEVEERESSAPRRAPPRLPPRR